MPNIKQYRHTAFRGALITLLFLSGCTEQQEFTITNPINQTVQAGRNLLNTGSWRPLPSSARVRTLDYIASEGFLIPAGYVETAKLNNEIQDFINTYNITPSDVIYLDGLRDSSGITIESKNAINRIKSSLQTLGFTSNKPTTPIATLDPSRHNAAILIHRKVIVAPDCTPLPHPNGTRPSRLTFGCAQEVNLANMVVSPEALDGSTPMSSADATAATLGIDRYRIGKVTPLATAGVASGSSE